MFRLNFKCLGLHPLNILTKKKHKLLFYVIILFFVGSFLYSSVLAQQKEDSRGTSFFKNPTLVKAAMCEEVKKSTPKNQAVVFSMNLGRVFCYTSFDPVPEKTIIHHNWFYRDKLSSKINLVLNPPRYSTYSRIQLRENDKGPWRVEITDKRGNILDILRFSVVD